MVVDVAGEAEARKLGSRCVCVKQVWEYWADASTYDELHAIMRDRKDLWVNSADRYQGYCSRAELAHDKGPWREAASWKFAVHAFNGTLSTREQVERINSCRYMDFTGMPEMKNPDVVVCLFEEHAYRPRASDDVKLVRLWMGRKVCDGPRELVDKFDLKKRAYIGTTSMESEVSLYMANQALAGPGKLIYDPFGACYPTPWQV